MKQKIYLFSLLGFFLAFIACSSSDNDAAEGAADNDNDNVNADESSGDAQAGSGAVAALTTLSDDTTSDVSNSESVAQAVKTMIKNGTKFQTVDVNETLSFPCTESGNISTVLDGTVTIDQDENTFSIDIDMEATFDECADNITETLTDGECDFSTVVDGAISCSLVASGEGSDFDGMLTCNTSAACSGMNITVDGEEHTIGMDIEASFSLEDSAFAITGTLCVDGDTFSAADLQDLDEFNAEELCGE